LAKKWEIIQDIERGLSRMEVAVRHGVSKSAVNDAYRIREEIKAYLNAGGNMDMKHIVHKPSTYYIQNAMAEWVDEMRAAGIPVTCSAIRGQSTEFAKEVGIDMRGSNGWLESFCRRYKMKSKRITCESPAVDKEIVTEWKEQLPRRIEQYSTKDIDCNCNETESS
jgi:hypothetical protein